MAFLHYPNRLFWFTWVIASPLCAQVGQVSQRDRPLHVLLAITSPPGPGDSELNAVFTRLLKQSMVQGSQGLPYTSARVGSTDHDTQCSELEGGVIATLQPLVYLRCQKEMGDSALIPLFVVKKNHESVAYYTASLVVAKRSRIKSVHDTTIKILYLNHPRSASGFVAPLNRLATLRAITAPTVSAARSRFGSTGVLYLRRRWDVARKVAEDPYALGAVAGFDSTLRPLDEKYQELPQDVLVITGDLRTQAATLRRIIPGLFATDSKGGRPPGASLATSAYNITGVEPFDAPFRSMYTELARQTALMNVNQSGSLDNFWRSVASVKHGVDKTNGLLASIVLLATTLAGIYRLWARTKQRPVPGGPEPVSAAPPSD